MLSLKVSLRSWRLLARWQNNSVTETNWLQGWHYGERADLLTDISTSRTSLPLHLKVFPDSWAASVFQLLFLIHCYFPMLPFSIADFFPFLLLLHYGNSVPKFATFLVYWGCPHPTPPIFTLAACCEAIHLSSSSPQSTVLFVSLQVFPNWVNVLLACRLFYPPGYS